MLTLTDLVLAAGIFTAAVWIIAAACVAQQWRWERRYDQRKRTQIETIEGHIARWDARKRDCADRRRDDAH